MKVKHLDHLNLSVHDLDESADWYARVFGFEIEERGTTQQGQRWAILRSGEALLCLYEHPEREMLDSAALDARRIHGLSHFGLRIQDRSTWEETVTREHIAVSYGGEVDWPHASAWYVRDPTGYEIEVALWDDDTITF